MPIKDCDRKARANYAKKCVQISVVIYPTKADSEIMEYVSNSTEPKATVAKRLMKLGLEAEKNRESSD